MHWNMPVWPGVDAALGRENGVTLRVDPGSALGIRPIAGPARLFGFAFTVRFAPIRAVRKSNSASSSG